MLDLSDQIAAEGILFTDQYQLTMAQLYFRVGLHEKPAQFDYYFRDYPNYEGHMAGYCVNAGLEWLLAWMLGNKFLDNDIEYLRGQKSLSGDRLFEDDFLNWLTNNGNFSHFNIRAVPEGRLVHPVEPTTVVEGPLAMAQILETPLLNHLNYQTLVATKASRIVDCSQRGLVLEFGLRRAHGKGANAGARAALIGGAAFTSNVGMSRALNLPPKGTHAHSMVQVFLALGGSELDAFRAYADVYPDDCLLLVDTIDTIESGIPNAIKVFEELKTKGHEPLGIRLDSGDLAYLSIQAARELNKAGFPDTSIVLSNNLDELVIWQIITQIQREAHRYDVDADQLISRLVYGVGTRLITSWGYPALGGVYKLVSINAEGKWIPALKLSETKVKIPLPGQKNIWRLYDKRGKSTADLVSLYDEDVDAMKEIPISHPFEPTKRRHIHRRDLSHIEPLLVDVMKNGKVIAELPDIDGLRTQREEDIKRLDPGVRRLLNPHIYHISITEGLRDLKESLIESIHPTV